MKFNRIAAGHYATPDGCYAAVSDGWGFTNQDFTNETGVHGQEWAAIYSPDGGLREDHQIGETLEWFDTKFEAVEACKRHAEKETQNV